MLRPVFKSLFRQLQRGRALEALTFLDGHYLLALDGTEYFSSKESRQNKLSIYTLGCRV
jgi:hypothetical protein